MCKLCLNKTIEQVSTEIDSFIGRKFITEEGENCTLVKSNLNKTCGYIVSYLERPVTLYCFHSVEIDDDRVLLKYSSGLSDAILYLVDK
jgi:hypothetical protein